MARVVKVDRRDFLKVTGAAGAGLVLGFALPSGFVRAAEQGSALPAERVA